MLWIRTAELKVFWRLTTQAHMSSVMGNFAGPREQNKATRNFPIPTIRIESPRWFLESYLSTCSRLTPFQFFIFLILISKSFPSSRSVNLWSIIHANSKSSADAVRPSRRPEFAGRLWHSGARSFISAISGQARGARQPSAITRRYRRLAVLSQFIRGKDVAERRLSYTPLL
jgi:hypothetical protein